MAHTEKKCIKRLMADLEELRTSPVANVAAAPLDNNMLEWHCNIRQDDIIFHLILFFPPEYPYKSPSAEFVPRGFSYGGGATKDGTKGTQICLNIFSDFEKIHTEWADQKGFGWSPGYTIQTVLMNVVSFLGDCHNQQSQNLKLSRSFKCVDCGHSYGNPIPSLNNLPSENKPGKEKDSSKNTDESNDASSKGSKPQIIDYISKQQLKTVVESDEDLFGYGLVVNGPPGRCRITTPCEFLMAGSFHGMMNSMNVVHSVLRQNLSYFLPLYIHPNHGSHIQHAFESVMKNLSSKVLGGGVTAPLEDIVIKTIPNLMCATVVEFSNGTQHTSENSLNGYFALHRLFLWALDTYPALQGKVEDKLKRFVEDETNRTKSQCPDIGQWLMLLSGSRQFRWQNVAQAYLDECWRRNVMWYVKDDRRLANLGTPQTYRLQETFKRTVVSRKLLAFQVVFLDIAMPEGITRDEIIQRYDQNFGFPTEEMVTRMKADCYKIDHEIHSFADWYKIVKVPAPSDGELFRAFSDAVQYASITYGYFFSR